MTPVLLPERGSVVAKLSPEEQAAFDKLKQKMEAPDGPPPPAPHLNVSLDLGDPEQVTLGQRLGLLNPFKEDPKPEGNPEGGDPEGGDPPARKGFFGGQ